ncbi:hypothetical protein [Candidatus Similichlamydia laticola]|uniref:Uncharacterized protein n=1 Tax=Candidatus Similichlamydia laticola TaxID=2170265 RepID=A0A369KE99_9BACT|nr:hypothetical protein [Candidatus Similichlamydia laticola]RDB31227.1 hypothetical protein HAT2_00707 [Candidatus Similichlamydia laticola]
MLFVAPCQIGHRIYNFACSQVRQGYALSLFSTVLLERIMFSLMGYCLRYEIRDYPLLGRGILALVCTGLPIALVYERNHFMLSASPLKSLPLAALFLYLHSILFGSRVLFENKVIRWLSYLAFGEALLNFIADLRNNGFLVTCRSIVSSSWQILDEEITKKRMHLAATFLSHRAMDTGIQSLLRYVTNGFSPLLQSTIYFFSKLFILTSFCGLSVISESIDNEWKYREFSFGLSVSCLLLHFSVFGTADLFTTNLSTLALHILCLSSLVNFVKLFLNRIQNKLSQNQTSVLQKIVQCFYEIVLVQPFEATLHAISCHILFVLSLCKLITVTLKRLPSCLCTCCKKCGSTLCQLSKDFLLLVLVHTKLAEKAKLIQLLEKRLEELRGPRENSPVAFVRPAPALLEEEEPDDDLPDPRSPWTRAYDPPSYQAVLDSPSLYPLVSPES